MVHLDHLIFATPKLEEGMDIIEEIFGMRPVFGGRHPKYGTHNALLGLRPNIYLEVIAPDPTLNTPVRGRFLENKFLEESRLVTWVLRTDQIEEIVSNALNSGIDLGEIESGSRLTPDGKELAWKVSDPYAMLFDGAVPFVIDWGKTPHPSMVLPVAGELLYFSIQHPKPTEVRNAFTGLGLEVEVSYGSDLKFNAEIKTLNHQVITLS